MSLLGARAPGSPVPPGALTLYGVPYDATSSFRRGSRLGPEAIRWASESIETYSPVQALTPHHPDLVIVQWDAHADLRDEYRGERIGHATVMRRLLDGGCPVVQLGVRAGTREELHIAQHRALHCSREVMPPRGLLDRLAGRALYLTIDIDVLDPGIAPGTGNPEPDGATYDELLTALGSLASHRIVGMDLVEVSPPCDPTGLTPIVAASLVREMILLFAPRRTDPA